MGAAASQSASGRLHECTLAERLLLAAHDPAFASLRRHILEGAGYEVVATPTLEATLAALQESNFALILLSHTMPEAALQQLSEAARTRNVMTVLICPTAPDNVTVDRYASIQEPLLPLMKELLSKQAVAPPQRSRKTMAG